MRLAAQRECELLRQGNRCAPHTFILSYRAAASARELRAPDRLCSTVRSPRSATFVVVDHPIPGPGRARGKNVGRPAKNPVLVRDYGRTRDCPRQTQQLRTQRSQALPYPGGLARGPYAGPRAEFGLGFDFGWRRERERLCG